MQLVVDSFHYWHCKDAMKGAIYIAEWFIILCLKKYSVQFASKSVMHIVVYLLCINRLIFT